MMVTKMVMMVTHGSDYNDGDENGDDGANDVAMIQEAHVGLGIAGKEGKFQAIQTNIGARNLHQITRLIQTHTRRKI